MCDFVITIISNNEIKRLTWKDETKNDYVCLENIVGSVSVKILGKQVKQLNIIENNYNPYS